MNVLETVFFVVVFAGGFSPKFIEKGHFHEHAVYGGILGLFPHQLLVNGVVCHVGHWWWFAVCVWCDVNVMAISENPCLWWWN